MAGERGDIRDHAIRHSRAFSIEGRREILSTLGIPIDETGRTLPPPDLALATDAVAKLAYNQSRLGHVAEWPQGAGTGFGDRYILTNLGSGAPFFYTFGVNQLREIHLLLFRARDFGNGLVDNTVLVNVPEMRIDTGEWTLDITASNRYLSIAPALGVETVPGDTVQANVVSEWPSANGALPSVFSTGTTMAIRFVRSIQPALALALPDILVSGPTAINYSVADSPVRTSVREVTSRYDQAVLDDLSRRGVEFEYAYPTVRPMLTVSGSVPTGRKFLTSAMDLEFV